MVRRTITAAQRFGVWKAWSGRCFWCREQVQFQACHIDHVIPLSKARELSKLIEAYALPQDFDLDTFENWVPTHVGCNQRKGQDLVDSAPAFALHLMQVRNTARLARANAEEIEKDRRKAPLLAKLERAVTAGDITESEIRDLLAGLPIMIKKGVEDVQGDQRLFIAPGWEIIESRGGRDMALVRTPSGSVGITSLAPDADWSWTCPTCGNRGPWDGVICRSCGYRSEPD